MPSLQNDSLTIEVAERGAELRSLRTQDGAEWLWQGDPAWWTGRSPLLFPVVGKSPADQVSIAGKAYPMKPHGFARTLDFTVAGKSQTQVDLVLKADDTTRASYPFEFELVMSYKLDGASLWIGAMLYNRDTRPMPAQFGFHPAFNWPLPGAGGATHAVVLEDGNPSACYRLDADKLLMRTTEPTPFVDGRMIPSRQMFDADAMIFLDGVGNRMRFEGGGSSIDILAQNLPQLGIWQKLGAPYLCIEPWQGTAPFNDTGDALDTRNGAITLSPRASARFAMQITPRLSTSSVSKMSKD